ncbi:MAG TPA: tRNA isopentenyl-2-thiomethyl-A-37 hydroxylase MiaE [Planctomycetota bacterium]|nr:tRNA isopentenyl-2-thiomethyl-A-37 hydroxylase MiaE [Planctomycetota bacterium]
MHQRFPLPYRTPPGWAAGMAAHLPVLLVDQAQLEKKAAAAAMSFLFRVPVEHDVHRALSALAREELLHFERTLRLLQQRRIALAPLPPAPYAERLKQKVAATMPARLCDELLVSAVIEARSHERMALLAGALQPVDAEVAAFYADLVEAEGRHQAVYLEVALQVFPAAAVTSAWQALAAHEAVVLAQLPWLPRLHGGLETVARHDGV